MKANIKANKKWREKNKDKIKQIRIEFMPKDHDLIDRFNNVEGKNRNEKLRMLLDTYEKNITSNYELKQDNE